MVTKSPRSLPASDAGRRRSSGNQAAEYIRRLIFEGQLKPGERVPQDDVAEALSLSRIPVREGLIALEREGWVTIELNRGAFVNALDAEAIRDSYELFGLVYGFATRCAMARSDGGLVDQLAAIEQELRATDGADEFERLAAAFHNTTVDAARSPRIKVVLRATARLVTGNYFAEVPGAIEVERSGAAAIVKALRTGDVDAAADAYLDMLRRQGELVVRVFESRGLFAAA
ncbi:MAG: transcriptional regulator, GntR family [Actinomycetia bacterium]|nr:transcriptional regulator, GntR family [Actinomycetes bacterium]